METGKIVHFAPNTFQDRECDDFSTPLSEIDPDIDTDNWIECAVNLGALYRIRGQARERLLHVAGQDHALQHRAHAIEGRPR